MKKLLTLAVIGSSLIIDSNPTKADWDHWAIKNVESAGFGTGDSGKSLVGTFIYTIDSATGTATLRDKTCHGGYVWDALDNQWECDGADNHYLDSDGSLIINTSGNNYKKFNKDTFSFESGSSNANWKSNYSQTFSRTNNYEDSNGNKIIEIKGNKIVEKKSDGSVQIGSDTNDIDITAEGLNVAGNPLITKKDNGEIHIGKNSLITKSEEETLSDGTKVQPLYAKDADGNKIPINIDGSKLLIDGVEVTAGGDSAQVTTNKNNISTNTSNIKKLGEGVAGSTALTAALSALPQTSKESKLTCGVGSGAYSSRYAVGFGCASKVNERVDINAGGSYVFGGSKSYGEGTLDSGVIKAGFAFKLGELNKSQKISKTEKAKLESKIGSLEATNKKLLARLERLEKVTLGDLKSKDLAVYKIQ